MCDLLQEIMDTIYNRFGVRARLEISTFNGILEDEPLSYTVAVVVPYYDDDYAEYTIEDAKTLMDALTKLKKEFENG